MIIGISGKKQHGKDTVAEILQEISEVSFERKMFAGKLKQIVCLLLGCTMEELEDPVFKETVLGDEWTKYKVTTHYIPETLDSERHDYYEEEYYFSNKEEAIAFGRSGQSADCTFIKRRPNNGTFLKTKSLSEILMTPRLMLQLLGTEGGRNVIHPNIWVNATMADYKPYEVSWIITDVRFPNEAKAIKDAGGVLIRVVREGMSTTDQHPSETALDDYYGWDFVIDNDGTKEELKQKVIEICKTLN